ncbi:MAG: hypothetical protein IJS82_03570 [Paludibacteraceae bacterium]|nr:hypothetical protein [Paludibacteraceae bacterium]
MTDYSKIKTLEELEYQTHRLQRRADIQRKTLEGHADYVEREYNHLVSTVDAIISPVRKTFNEYRTTLNVISRVIRAFIPKRK